MSFTQRIENEPFIPLVVERQGDELYLTHYLTQNGDMFIDAEMVFTVLPEGQLQFKETAVSRSSGWRVADSGSAVCSNLLEEHSEARGLRRRRGLKDKKHRRR